MYTVKQKTLFTKTIKNGAIQTCYLMHITVDTVADIPNAKENWLAGSRCDVLEDGGHVYMLSNGREWFEVNFYNLGGESDSTDLSDYYTMSQTDERLLEIEEKILDNINNVGQFYLVDDEVKGEIFNDYANNVASGQYSHAEGSWTTASGLQSHTEGYYAKASGRYAHAEGRSCTASAEGSHAEGTHAIASGNFSHAEGGSTTAKGLCSHAEGDNTTASKDGSHAEGCHTTTSGLYSHAEGYYTTASAYYSHAEGNYTTARGNHSHAEGGFTLAEGYYSHAEGYYTTAKAHYSHVGGKYNVIDTNNKYAFIIGNGTSDSDRSNAVAIDWNGNIYVNNSDTPVNVLDLLNRISALENKIAELENSANT